MNSFLRWAGGKKRSVNLLLNYVPKNINEINYWEPFLGAGSLFFRINCKKAYLSDLNNSLINCYKFIKKNPNGIYRILKSLRENHNKKYYYIIRNDYNTRLLDLRNAAEFIYLNKTSFNGIYRVNKANKYNVPYGKIKKPKFPSIKELKEISNKLKSANLNCYQFSKIINKVCKDDFIYLDPPYPPINGTSYFTNYTKEGFGYKDHEEVASFANELSNKKCKVMISNSDTPKIRKLYSGWEIVPLSVYRTISCKKNRYKVQELLIKNF